MCFRSLIRGGWVTKESTIVVSQNRREMLTTLAMCVSVPTCAVGVTSSAGAAALSPAIKMSPSVAAELERRLLRARMLLSCTSMSCEKLERADDASDWLKVVISHIRDSITETRALLNEPLWDLDWRSFYGAPWPGIGRLYDANGIEVGESTPPQRGASACNTQTGDVLILYQDEDVVADPYFRIERFPAPLKFVPQARKNDDDTDS